MDKEERQNLIKESGSLKREISVLRAGLNEANKKKEDFFEKRDVLKKEILEKVKKLKENFDVKNVGKVDVKKIKVERDKHNAKVRELISKFRDINKKKQELLEKNKIKNISRIDEEIEKLDRDIETKALSFKNEQKLMDKIKNFKKVKKEIDEIIGKDADDFEKEIDRHKKKADEEHEKIKKFLEGRKKYKGFILSSREINELRKKEKDFHNFFLKSKNEFGKINKGIKVKLLVLKGIDQKFNDERKLKENKKEKEKEKMLEIKSREVEEKIKKGKKLTEEDLIAFQG